MQVQDKTVFTTTEARQNFFELLRMVEEGKEPVIIKKDRNIKFKMIIFKEEKKKKNFDKILKEMGEIGLPALPIKKMNKILSTMHEIKI